jgi:hypothetical protein
VFLWVVFSRRFAFLSLFATWRLHVVSCFDTGMSIGILIVYPSVSVLFLLQRDRAARRATMG